MEEKRTSNGNIAVVMSGGGALGAYEAGAMLYTLQTLSREKGYLPHFDIFTGTSVGAINTSFLAASADDPCDSAEQLAAFWMSLSPGKVMRFGLDRQDPQPIAQPVA